MECKHFSRTRPGVAGVSKACDDSGAFVDEGQRLLVADPLELGSSVARRLILHGRDLVAPVLRFGLDDANGAAVHKQDIVCRADISLIFSDGDPQPRAQVDAILVLNMPSRLDQTGVDLIARYLFRCLIDRCQWTTP